MPIVEEPATEVVPLEQLEAAWEQIYADHLLPLTERYPDLPIMLLEMAYSNALIAASQPAGDSYTPMGFEDSNGNGLDDGDETQANLWSAFFSVTAAHPGVIDGVFVWDNMIATQEEWRRDWADIHRMTAIRLRPAEAVVREWFDTWRDQD
jgi:hypothetical protein